MHTSRARRFACLRRRAGFSLIELLVVIAIIGLLASLVLAYLNSARMRARDARRISDLRTIQTALEFYDEACGQYPQPSPLALGDNNGCPAGSGITLGTFLPTIPKDPGTPRGPTDNNNYLYTALKSGASAAICTGYHLGVIFEGQPPPGAACVLFSGQSCTGGNYKGGGTNGNMSGIGATGGDFDNKADDGYCGSETNDGYNYIYDIVGS